MGDKSNIEWTDATWNPIVGCSVVSKGCTNCYAMKTAGARTVHTAKYQGLTKPSNAGPVWTGEVRLWERALTDPLKWRDPRRVFVNSMGDLFHEGVPDDWIDRVFAVMALCPQHTFQVLTKRPERMLAYATDINVAARIASAVATVPNTGRLPMEFQMGWPLPNVWLGISCEDQATADDRIPILLQTPAAVRFMSAEPLLGPIDLNQEGALWRYYESGRREPAKGWPNHHPRRSGGIDWVIAGGESGPHARPMHPVWAQLLRDQCAVVGVPFFFKQWGEWGCIHQGEPGDKGMIIDDSGTAAVRVGKKRAGRILDGRTWDEYPPA